MSFRVFCDNRTALSSITRDIVGLTPHLLEMENDTHEPRDTLKTSGSHIGVAPRDLPQGAL